MQLLQTTDISRISVRDLCEKAGINRTTFYNHYGCPFDVLKEMSQTYLADIEHTLNSGTTGEQADVNRRVEIVFGYILEHIELSKILINSNLDSHFSESLFSLPKVTQLLEQTLSSVQDAAEKASVIAFAISGSYKLIQDWVNAENRLPAEKEAQIVLMLAKRVCSP